MFNYSRDLLPECFDNLFTFNNQIHDHNTRAVTKYRSHACRTNIKQFTILHQGPKIWNCLPPSITEINTIKLMRALLLNYHD